MTVFTGTINLDKYQQVLAETVLPKLGEWVTITKDFMIDLGGRYINFQIISELMWAWYFI